MSNNPVATHITKNNVTTDLHDRRLPSSLGTSDQVLKMNNAGTQIEWGTIDISSKEDTSNKVTTLTAQSTDIQYPSAKAVYDYHDSTKQNNIEIEELP